MNQEDQKVRSQWKTMLVTMTLFSLAHQCIFQLYDPSFQFLAPTFKLVMNICNVVGVMSMNYWFYHCAYKKGGTKFLSFSLIASPSMMIGMAIMYILKFFQFPTHIPFYWLLTLISYALVTWMFILNWKMRKVNRRIKLAA